VDASPFAANVLIGIGKPVVGPLMKVANESEQEWVNTILLEISKKDPTVKIPAKTSEKSTNAPTSTLNQVQKPSFCKYCGSALTANSVFCSQCGKRVE
jgi:membrane protease subunit (stomatin/prohibitin family)